MDLQFIQLFSKNSKDPLTKFLLSKDKNLKKKISARKEDDSKAYTVYSTFKQASPLLPIIPSLYDLVTSKFSSGNDSTLALFDICDALEDIAVAFYSLTAAILYQFFKASKNSHHVMRKRRDWSKIIRRSNKFFILFCIFIALSKIILGYITSDMNADSEKITTEEYMFDLISKLGLVIAELFYLHSVFLKKFYKLNDDEDKKQEKSPVDLKKEDDTREESKEDEQAVKLDTSNEEIQCDILTEETNTKPYLSFLEKEGNEELKGFDRGALKQILGYAQDNRNYIEEFTNLLKTHNDSKEELERLKIENIELKNNLNEISKGFDLEISQV